MYEIVFRDMNKDFNNIITGDESWFLYEYTQSTQWVLSREDLIDKVVKTNMQKKKNGYNFF